MLVNCPRCGFTQPKDKYCAQCGVDTETFKPPRESSMKKLMSSPVLFLGIAILAAVIFFKSYSPQNTADIKERVRFLKGTSQVAKATAAASQPETTAPEAAAEAPANRDLASESDPQQAQALTGAASTTVAAVGAGSTAPAALGASGASATAPSKAVNPEEPSVFIYYAEVPRRALEKIQEESQATGQFNNFGDYTAGILPDVAKRIHSDAMKITIHEKSQKNINVEEKWFTGIHDAELEEDIGLSTYIQISDTENGSFRGNLEIKRAWREMAENGNGGSVQKRTYPAIFELNPGAGFFIAGMLPRKSHLPHEDELSTKGAFQIWNSEQFKNKESEFVIFIEFRKKP